jgi:thioesterase domain-containing protein/acyl carrier protein
MVPQAWVLLDALPSTPNGKVDRTALPSLDGAGAFAAHVPGETAAGTETERRVAAIWGEVLGIPSVGVNANFFDLGGHSLRALRVVLKVRDELGVDVPVAALIQANTVRRFAALVDRSGGDGGRPLVVPLNAPGHPAVFVFHPLGGHVFGYAPLARALDGVASLHGVRACGMEPGESPLHTISELVDRYLAELRAIQPAGPYHLAGWCMGATVALEVSRRLREQGERVGFLGLIVANPFDPAPRMLLDDPVDLLLHAVGTGADLDRDEVMAIPDLQRRVEYVFHRSQATGVLREDVSSSDDAHRLLRVYQANATAIGSQRPAPYDGAAHVFVLPAESPCPPDMGWSAVVVGPTHRHELPGAAGTFLEAGHVGRLAAIIGAAVTDG